MRRYLYLLSPVLVLLSVSYAIAQTLTTDAPVSQMGWEVALKLIFPIIMTALSPYLTGLITSNFAKVPPPVQYAITSILSLVMGGLAGAIPGFPMGPESAATVALGSGNTGQFLANSSRADLHPKTDRAKIELAAMPKDPTVNV